MSPGTGISTEAGDERERRAISAAFWILTGLALALQVQLTMPLGATGLRVSLTDLLSPLALACLSRLTQSQRTVSLPLFFLADKSGRYARERERPPYDWRALGSIPGFYCFCSSPPCR